MMIMNRRKIRIVATTTISTTVKAGNRIRQIGYQTKAFNYFEFIMF